MAKPIPIIIFVLSALTRCGGSPSLASRVPANNEIPAWTLAGRPQVANSDTELYNQIDGSALQYIDRGWVATVFATYQQGDDVVQVAIHDMGSSANALALFNFDLPISRVQIDNQANAVVDPSGSMADAYVGQYVIEVLVDESSNSALDTAQRFVRAILKRCE
jgi:hypothetical protein